jgi:SSS family solute:Na+ symporter
LVATVFGASSTMGIIGLGYARGLTGAWWSLIGGIALIPCALLLSSRVRDLNVYTLPDILRKAYGDKVAIPAGVMIGISWCGVIAAQLIAGGRLVSSLFSLDVQVALGLVAVIFTTYTFWGGQLSVVRTDAWQLVLFVGGLLLSLGLLLFSLPGGTTRWQAVPPGHWQFPVSEAFGWYEVLVFYPLIVGLPYLVGPDIYSRIFCARDGRTAKRAVLQAAVMVIPLSFLLALFGVLVKAHFPDIPSENALPQTLNALVPSALKGLIVAGFLGAIMSSADTCLISAATILTLNVVHPLYKTTKERHYRITKATVVILGGMAWLIASRQTGIIASLLLGYTVFVGGVVIPTLASFLRGRLSVHPWGAVSAVILGGGMAILGKIDGGILLKGLLTPQGVRFLETILGPKYMSLFPLILSALCVTLVGRMGASPGIPSMEKR